MKVAVVGNGHVGITVFRELQAFREIHELVLVGRNADACQAEAEDYLDAIPLRLDTPGVIRGGSINLAENADILVYSAGPSVSKDGPEDRTSIADANMQVMREVFAELDRIAPNAIVIVISNPLDLMVTAVTKLSKRPASKVIGTGTLLDTARMLHMLSESSEVSVRNISGYVLGEHGATAVPILSSIQVMNMSLERYIEKFCSDEIPLTGEKLTAYVVDQGFKIFRGKGYTSSGVAAAAARIIFDIANDQNEVLPVSTVLSGEYGVDGWAMSVPCQIGREGIVSVKEIYLTPEEEEKLAHSADAIKKCCEDAGML